MAWAEKPILCLYRCTTLPMRRFLGEMLVQEGYLNCQEATLDGGSDVGALLSDDRALVFVSADEMDERDAGVLARWVRDGGRAVLLAPPDGLVRALGLSVEQERAWRGLYGCAPAGYGHLTDHPWTAHHAGLAVQVHAPTAVASLRDARPVAWYGPRRSRRGSFPAVVDAPCGRGRVAIFWFDLGTSVALTRQGDPLRASNGPLAGSDGIRGFKTSGLFFGHLDPELADTPQADVWADALVAVIRGLTDDRLPLPRVWLMPADSPALTLLDGDSDVYCWDSYERLVVPCLEAGIPYTLNLMPAHLAGLDLPRARSWMERGNDFELHWLVPSRPTVEQMAVGVGEQRRVFEQAFDGMAPVGGRAHSLYWAGYTETAAILAANGLRIETDFMTPRGCQHGYCGSARPARFIAPSGDLLAVRQQPTVLMDDAMSNDKLLLPACSAEDAYGIAAQLYDETAERFHGVICACLHPSLSPGFRYKLPVQDALRSAAIDSTRRHGLKAMTYRAWSAFLEARGLVDLRFEAGRWVARAGAAIQDATFHAPAAEGVRRQGLSWQSVTRSLAQGETFALG